MCCVQKEVNKATQSTELLIRTVTTEEHCVIKLSPSLHPENPLTISRKRKLLLNNHSVALKTLILGLERRFSGKSTCCPYRSLISRIHVWWLTIPGVQPQRVAMVAGLQLPVTPAPGMHLPAHPLKQ